MSTSRHYMTADPAKPHPALMIYEYHVRSDRVGVIDLANQQFHEPFFVQSVESRSHDSPAPLEIAGDRDTVRAASGVLSAQSPIPCRGLIFHTGRCGSTLLANALSRHKSLLVLKEPPFAQQISADLMVYGSVSEEELRFRATDICDHFVPATRESQTKYLLKLTSWNTLCASRWRRMLPSSPVIFLWRSALGVLESVARNPTGWIVGEESTIAPEQLVGRYIEAPDPRIPYPLAGAFEVWRSTARIGLALAAEGALVLEYDRVVADFPAAIQQVLEHISAPADSPCLAQILAGAERYSKDPAQRWSPFPDPGSSLDGKVAHIIEQKSAELEIALRHAGRPYRT